MNNKFRTSYIIFTLTVLTQLSILLPSCRRDSRPLPDTQDLLDYRNATASKVLSADGELIGKVYYQNRTNISFSQLPDHLVDALVATEDARFFTHSGVDSRSLARVLFKTILGGNRRSGGGSTITQQLAKNMYGRQKKGIFSIVRNKTREMVLARRIEKTYSKEEILTIYLNTVSFGEDLYGIESAAMRYFNSRVEDLKIEESAVLIGLLRAPTFYNPVRHPENAVGRRDVVLSQMEKYNYLDPSVADSLRSLPMITDFRSRAPEGMTGYFIAQVKNEMSGILEEVMSRTGKEWDPETDGLIIETTLNMKLQTYAAEAFHEHLPPMQERLWEQYNSSSAKKHLKEITDYIIKEKGLSKRADERRVQMLFSWDGSYPDSISIKDSVRNAITLLHAGLLAMDPRTGAIMAWVGGIDYVTQPYDQVLARRQQGSVFKPVLYAAAFENGCDPCEYLDNDSVVVSGYDEWSPGNFDSSYGGKYSLAAALARSMNVPSFNLFMKTGFDSVDSLWKDLGFSFPLRNTPALPLGTAEASIRETAIAYSAFANGGYRVEPFSIVSIRMPSGEVIYRKPDIVFGPGVLSERTGLLLDAILQKAVDEGTGASVRSRFGVEIPLAGKTGTTQNYADAWFAAFNPGLTIVARAGASTPAIHFESGAYGTGSALALPLVALTLKKALSEPELRQQIAIPFSVLPPDLEYALDCPDFKEDTFVDKFIDIFRSPEIVFDTTGVKTDRSIRSIIRKIFRR